MKTKLIDFQVLGLPDGSDLAVAIYEQENGALLFQPACYAVGQPELFEAFIKTYAAENKNVERLNIIKSTVKPLHSSH
jgi:hypothetical protein